MMFTNRSKIIENDAKKAEIGVFFKTNSKYNKKIKTQGTQNSYKAKLIAIKQGITICPPNKNIMVIIDNKAIIEIINNALNR